MEFPLVGPKADRLVAQTVGLMAGHWADRWAASWAYQKADCWVVRWADRWVVPTGSQTAVLRAACSAENLVDQRDLMMVAPKVDEKADRRAVCSAAKSGFHLAGPLAWRKVVWWAGSLVAAKVGLRAATKAVLTAARLAVWRVDRSVGTRAVWRAVSKAVHLAAVKAEH